LRQIRDLLSRIETTINSEIKEVRTIKTIEKHLRITEEAYELIRNRDRKKFPLERDFINEAIITYADRIEMRELSKEFKDLKKITEKLYKTVGWV